MYQARATRKRVPITTRAMKDVKMVDFILVDVEGCVLWLGIEGEEDGAEGQAKRG